MNKVKIPTMITKNLKLGSSSKIKFKRNATRQISFRTIMTGSKKHNTYKVF